MFVDLVKGGDGVHPPPPPAPPSPARAGFVIMMECMYVRNIVIAILCNQRRYDMNGRFQMQGGKNWILPKEMNANRFFWDSHWLEIWSKHLLYVPLWGRMEGAWLWTQWVTHRCLGACTLHGHSYLFRLLLLFPPAHSRLRKLCKLELGLFSQH